MKYDLLIKCFIAFCIGVIVYKFISDRCSCGIVEGQNQNNNSPPSQEEIDPDAAFTQQEMFGNQPELTPPSPIPNMEPVTPLSKQSLSNIDIETLKGLLDNINNNIFKNSIRDNIEKLTLAINRNSVRDIPSSIDTISSFEQFGEIPDALDYLELIVITITNLNDTEFSNFINSLIPDYCSTDEDLNAYVISMILLQYYNINVLSKQKYINISNKLSKYIPTILEKIQNLNETCDNSDKNMKSTIMDTMIYRLFKNNNTVINIGSLDSLVNELNKLPHIYGVVLMLCISYIIVRFLGMFSMKMEV
tara:strand:+ start:207 stop:1121 length:915 start_codon:yes stop_codon:yes gene_type:complete